jgi:hypothetical protein
LSAKYKARSSNDLARIDARQLSGAMMLSAHLQTVIMGSGPDALFSALRARYVMFNGYYGAITESFANRARRSSGGGSPGKLLGTQPARVSEPAMQYRPQ